MHAGTRVPLVQGPAPLQRVAGGWPRRHVGGLRVLAGARPAGPLGLPDVVGIASQPFWLFWTTQEGKARSHAPDYLARLAAGSTLVLDVRATDRIKPSDQAAFGATAEACEALGWRYEVVGAPPEGPYAEHALLANVRWLARYRHPRHQVDGVDTAPSAAFAAPAGLLDGAEQVGDLIAVLPVLFHIWRRDLYANLDRRCTRKSWSPTPESTAGLPTSH